MNRKLTALSAPLITLLFVAGCAGGGSGSDTGDAGGDAAPAARAPDQSTALKESQVARRADTQALDAASTGSDFSAQSAAKSGQPPSPPEYAARAVISKGTVSLQGDDVAQARFDVMKVVDEHGGEVSDEQTSTDDDGDVSSSRMVLRIPSEDFDSAMGELAKVPGTDLESAKRTSEDVTTQVIDTAVRIRAQKASIERIEALLQRASSIRSIVWIESQLTRRQADLDSLEQQQAYLTDQTSLSTITVYLEQTPDQAEPRKDDRDDSGFAAGLDSGWHALTTAATAVATLVGALLPFAILLTLLGVPLWLVVRQVLRRRVRSDRDPLPAP